MTKRIALGVYESVGTGGLDGKREIESTIDGGHQRLPGRLSQIGQSAPPRHFSLILLGSWLLMSDTL